MADQAGVKGWHTDIDRYIHSHPTLFGSLSFLSQPGRPYHLGANTIKDTTISPRPNDVADIECLYDSEPIELGYAI